MLKTLHFTEMASALRQNTSKEQLQALSNRIRHQLNPHTAGQMEYNVPSLYGRKLMGIQHKYRETVLFFPSQSQTCHAYCSFCFRWPQFVGIDNLKFAMRETDLLVKYIRLHTEVTDVLFTGGDAMVMKTKNLATYIDPLLKANFSHLRTIRIGTKALAYWPYRFLTDSDADDCLALFERIVQAGKHLAIMAHFNHPNELKTEAVAKAIARIRSTGAQIYTQSPILQHINDDADTWTSMWRNQVDLGLIPYYMFIVRDTGAQHYFAVPLIRSWQIFRDAYQRVSGLSRTVRGPSMSTDPGKVQVLGPTKVNGEQVLTLRFLQGRNPDWIHRPFFAQYDSEAVWLDELKPAFGDEKFFFQEEIESQYHGLNGYSVPELQVT
ncbi:lysine 2,3-aminomutase [Chloroflexi bacterium TSY]|nr:lysine 2,3-aminomutase [Chloroflexi bacterium TSY]